MERPGAPRGVTLNPLVAFKAILGLPGEGLGGLWGALEPPLGPLGASFFVLLGVFWNISGAVLGAIGQEP